MTFTRLTLGEPRLRSKIRGGAVEDPCVETVVTGSSLLPDGGFENYVASTGRTELPARSSGGTFPDYYWRSDLTEAVPFAPGEEFAFSWREEESVHSSTPNPWYISDIAPDTGTYHARNDVLTDDWEPNALAPYAYWPCSTTGPDGSVKQSHPRWPVTPGLIATFTCRATVSPFDAGANQLISMLLNYFDANDDLIDFDGLGSGENVLSGSYQTFQLSGTVPSGAVYLGTTMNPSMASTSFGGIDCSFYIDNVTLSIE